MVEQYLHSPHVFLAWYLIKYRGKFIFLSFLKHSIIIVIESRRVSKTQRAVSVGKAKAFVENPEEGD
jgi:hypothetical protein